MMRISALVGATALTLTLTACGSSSEDAATTDPMKDADSSSMTDNGGAKDDMTAKDDMNMDDAMGPARSGTFAGLNGKKVAGTVKVADGKVVLSGFSSDEGPDLYLYLAKGDAQADVAAGKSLGKVSYDTASQTFELDGVDADAYDTVVVHCDKAKVVFGAAELS